MKKIVIGVFLAVVLVVAMSQFHNIFGQTGSDAELLIVNATKGDIFPSIDNEAKGIIPYGDQQAYLVSVGRHSLYAKTLDGRYAETEANVPPEGFTWTVTEGGSVKITTSAAGRGNAFSALKK